MNILYTLHVFYNDQIISSASVAYIQPLLFLDPQGARDGPTSGAHVLAMAKLYREAGRVVEPCLSDGVLLLVMTGFISLGKTPDNQTWLGIPPVSHPKRFGLSGKIIYKWVIFQPAMFDDTRV